MRAILPTTVALAAALILLAGLRSLLRKSQGPHPHDTKLLLEDVRASTPEHAILRGWVRWPDGSPAKDVKVYLKASSVPQGRIPDQDSATDGDGFFRIEDVWPAEYYVEALVWGEGLHGRRAIACAVKERVNSAAFEIELNLVRFAPIRGIAVDSQHHPLPNVLVKAIGDQMLPLTVKAQTETVTDDRGRFEVWVVEGSSVALEGVLMQSTGDLLSPAGPIGGLALVSAGRTDIELSVSDAR